MTNEPNSGSKRSLPPGGICGTAHILNSTGSISELQIIKYNPKKLELDELVEHIFREKIEPIYGDQTQALQKIRKNIDRNCWLLFKKQEPLGLLVHKNHLTDEYANFGIRSATEIKTLLLIVESSKNAGLYFSAMLNHVAVMSIAGQAKALVATVSQKRPQVLHLMEKYGFRICHTYVPEHDGKEVEWLIAHQKPQKLLTDTRNYLKKMLRLSENR